MWGRPIAGSVVLCALAVIGLNLVDAFSTLHHVEWGALEVNPFMGRLLDAGPLAFLLGKHVLASGGVLGIVAHWQRGVARGMLRFVLLPLYGALAIYQVVLFQLL